jgi:hypothetical protein
VVFAAGLGLVAEESAPGLLLPASTIEGSCDGVLVCRGVASRGRWLVVTAAGTAREDSSFTASGALEDDFLKPNVVSLIDGNTFEMALARGIEANRTNHNPQITLANTMRIV